MSKSNVNKTFKELQKNSKGITLVALVITIVLNCLCSGRKLEYTA